jgi:hypothetical protein
MSSLLTRSAHMGMRRVGAGATLFTNTKAAAASFSSPLQQRFLSTKDVGDVIGIDLGTTNSCVAIMVSFHVHENEEDGTRAELDGC